MAAHLPERLKDICQKQDVGATVQGLALKSRPDLLRMGVVLVTDIRIGQLAVECFFFLGVGGGAVSAQ